jgi:hypothetical protein
MAVKIERITAQKAQLEQGLSFVLSMAPNVRILNKRVHSLNLELDLQSLFGLLCTVRTAVLIG